MKLLHIAWKDLLRALRNLFFLGFGIGVPVLTDVHENTPVQEVADVVDVLPRKAMKIGVGDRGFCGRRGAFQTGRARHTGWYSGVEAVSRDRNGGRGWD